MTFHYKRLGRDDLQPMRELLGVFADAFSEPSTYLSAQPGDLYLRNLLTQSHFVALTAATETRVIGGLTAYVLPKFEQERSEIYIYDLAVDKAYRRLGIASALIQHLQHIAKTCRAWVIFVQADPVDEAAMKLYMSIGQREDVCHFDILPDVSVVVPGPS
jgi:aminoglycoside 3-N-acetyltransferase I